MPSPKPDPEVAKTDAELTAEVTKDTPKAKRCPVDNTEMIQHPDHPHHPFYWHCNTCGRCAP